MSNQVSEKNKIESDEDLEQAFQGINKIQTLIADLAVKRAKKIEKVRLEVAKIEIENNLPEKEKELESLTEAVFDYATNRRKKGERVIEMESGFTKFRWGKWKVVLENDKKTDEDEAIELLKKHLPQYVREAPSIDKERILVEDKNDLVDYDALSKCGLKIYQEENFSWGTPTAKACEEALKRLKKA